MTPARKSKHSRDKAASRSKYAARRTEFRDPLPIVVVVCDDSRTAVKYFQLLKREYKDTVTIHALPGNRHGSDPRSVLSCAKSALSELKTAEDSRDRQSVWVLIDLEHDPKTRASAYEAKKSADIVQVALSEPCFELWTLSHLESTGSLYQTCQEVIQRLRAAWKAAFHEEFPGNKAQADYDKIVARRADAVANARSQHLNNAPSWTEVYLVIEDIERLASGGS